MRKNHFNQTLSMFDVRCSLDGRWYRPFVTDIAAATKDCLAAELKAMTGDDVTGRKSRADLVDAVIAASMQRMKKFDTDDDYRKKFYAFAPRTGFPHSG